MFPDYTDTYYSYVSDGSPITSITINQDPLNGYLYGLVVNGLSSGTNTDVYPMNPCPNLSTGFTFKQTVTLTAD